MSRLVVDASVALAWLFDDGDEPRAEQALEQMAEDGAVVPHLWHLETRNALLVAERRGRITAAGVKERLDALKGLPIVTDDEPDLQAAFDLARAHDLPFYDAIFLELAKREGARFATLDESLGRAAVAERVMLVVG